jgi:hypothetical protein
LALSMAVVTASTLWVRQIVEDDDIAGLELENEERLDPGAELLAVRRPIERARRDETVRAPTKVVVFQ